MATIGELAIMKRFISQAALSAAMLLASFGSAQAAFIAIDDSDASTITITAGDFERDFFVNGALLTTGLGASGSLTLPDGGNSVFGSWIDLGATPSGARVDLLYALPGSPTLVTSGVELGAGTDGFLGSLTGSFGGFTGTTYFSTALATIDQTSGVVGIGGFPFLSISFTPEVPRVPEPASLGLLGSAFAAFALARRRRNR